MCWFCDAETRAKDLNEPLYKTLEEVNNYLQFKVVDNCYTCCDKPMDVTKGIFGVQQLFCEHCGKEAVNTWTPDNNGGFMPDPEKRKKQEGKLWVITGDGFYEKGMAMC